MTTSSLDPEAVRHSGYVDILSLYLASSYEDQTMILEELRSAVARVRRRDNERRQRARATAADQLRRVLEGRANG